MDGGKRFTGLASFGFIRGTVGEAFLFCNALLSLFSSVVDGTGRVFRSVLLQLTQNAAVLIQLALLLS